MAKILVLIATGPENTTRGALGMLVAKTAAAEGHEVCLFLAGDAVHYARPETAESSNGVGTGSIAEHWADLAGGGVPVYLSGMSSKARGIEAGTRDGIELVQPQKLVELVDWADKTVTF